jgi:SAM-dependent methyltransferase
MSVFASVDTSDDPRTAIDYLNWTARSEAGMKQYAATAHALCEPRGFVLDVGCGAGHDLALLAGAGLRPLGVDPSRVMLQASARRGMFPVVQAIGGALPFRSGSFGGCRIERVLIHVADPVRLLHEVARCLVPGALLTVFEPDWSGYRVRDHGDLVSAGWLAPVAQPDAGGRLWEWVEASGFVVKDRVEELSVWRSLDTLRTVIDLDRAIAVSVAAGRIDARAATDWLARQDENQKRHEFFSLMPKVQIVAERRT